MQIVLASIKGKRGSRSRKHKMKLLRKSNPQRPQVVSDFLSDHPSNEKLTFSKSCFILWWLLSIEYAKTVQVVELYRRYHKRKGTTSDFKATLTCWLSLEGIAVMREIKGIEHQNFEQCMRAKFASKSYLHHWTEDNWGSGNAQVVYPDVMKNGKLVISAEEFEAMCRMSMSPYDGIIAPSENDTPKKNGVMSTCQRCGEQFCNGYRTKLYCSDDCCIRASTERAKARRQAVPAVMRKCALCDKEFIVGQKTKFCSHECSRNFVKTKRG